MTEAIVGFLRGIDIDVVAGDLGDDTFLPGIQTRDGRLVFDAERFTYPGDLLHEARHLAVLDLAVRQIIGTAGEDRIPEMKRTVVARELNCATSGGCARASPDSDS